MVVSLIRPMEDKEHLRMIPSMAQVVRALADEKMADFRTHPMEAKDKEPSHNSPLRVLIRAIWVAVRTADSQPVATGPIKVMATPADERMVVSQTQVTEAKVRAPLTRAPLKV